MHAFSCSSFCFRCPSLVFVLGSSRHSTSLFASYPPRTASPDVSLRDSISATCASAAGRWPFAGPAHTVWLSPPSGWRVSPTELRQATSLWETVSLWAQKIHLFLSWIQAVGSLWISEPEKRLWEAQRVTWAEYGECGRGCRVGRGQALALDPEVCGLGPNT